jgi:hypothetical protein
VEVESEGVVESEAIEGNTAVIKSRRKRIRQSASTLSSSDMTTTDTISIILNRSNGNTRAIRTHYN